MAEVLLPTWIIPEEETHEWLDEGSSVFAAAFAPGLAQRQSYGGLRLKLSRRHTVRGEEKAQLLSILQATRGRFNVLRTKMHFALRGAGFGGEILGNNTFANGVTGWTAYGGIGTSAVADRVMRITRILNDGASGIGFYNTSSITTLAQYAAYVLRAYVSTKNGAVASVVVTAGTSAGGAEIGTSTSAGSAGLARLAFVPSSVANFYAVAGDAGFNGASAGDYLDCPYISLALGPSVDNGSNMLLQSEEFDTSWTAIRSSVDDQTASTVAPDGMSTADSIIEDGTASNTHVVAQSVTVSSAAADYAFAVCLKAGARTWAQLVVTDNVLGQVSSYFNLSTGAVGTTATGSGWSDLRTFVVSMGNGWYRGIIVARKTGASTNLTASIALATGDGGASYSGDGTSNIYAWRATMAQSSLPTRLVSTTTTANSGTSQTGNALYLKGLPASTSGLLLPGDWFEVNGELKQTAAALNSDAAGLGYLQFEPALVRSPANEDPVIVTDPMGKFLVSNIKIDNQFGTQATVTYDLEHIYE